MGKKNKEKEKPQEEGVNNFDDVMKALLTVPPKHKPAKPKSPSKPKKPIRKSSS